MEIKVRAAAALIKISDLFIKQGVRIASIGRQGQIGLHHPSINEFEKSILAYADLGVEVMITKLDLSVLPSLWENAGLNVSASSEYEQKMNPYIDSLPDSVTTASNERCMSLFQLFLKHQDKI